MSLNGIQFLITVKERVLTVNGVNGFIIISLKGRVSGKFESIRKWDLGCGAKC